MNEKDPFGKTPAFTFRRSAARARRSAATALVVGCVLSPVLAADDDSAPRVAGRVLGKEEPVSAAQVFVWDVATYAVESVLTDQEGQFLFESLPAGLYKIIAHKPGFVPAVEMLLRRSREARQFVELELMAEDAGDVRQAETYWETRAKIPADVLQKIEQLGLASGEPSATLAHDADFEARMAAQGGVAQLGEGYGTAQLTDTTLGVRGTLGQTRVDVDGRYLELAATNESSPVPDGGVRSMSVALERPGEGRLSMATSSSDLAELRGDEAVDVDLTHYQLAWSGNAAGGSSDVSAQLIEESNYYNGGLEYGGLEWLPGASRTLAVQGSYSRDLTAHTSLKTGVSFRQREGYNLLNPDGTFNKDGAVKDEVMGLYGVAGSQLQPRVLVEYGVYSAMREDEMAFMPHGGVVVKLGSDWQAQASFTQRLEGRHPDSASAFERFNAASFSDESICHQIGEACYEVTFEREGEGSETLSVGAIHREFAETLRLYFSDDFFNRLESLLVVPGDELPELRFRMVRQVSPKVLAKLESNFASGGGGIFYATDSHAYQNEVRYLVASLDTRFQKTSTGVFLAFHHLEQALNPVSAAEEGSSASVSELEIQRLQLMLTQDLSALANIAPSLAVRFNMELSRGATPYQLTDDDEFHKKLTGGISLSF